MESFRIDRNPKKTNESQIPITPFVCELDFDDNNEKNITIDLDYEKEHFVNKTERDLRIAKEKLDNIDPKKFIYLRNIYNPYESIGFFFQNRAATKIAELDYHYNLVTKNTNLICDICSGPGGFSEYILTKRKWGVKVFGFTLKESDNFMLKKFNPSAPTETFHAYYGESDKVTAKQSRGLLMNTGDGDITNATNIENLSIRIGAKVNLVTADGGFNIKEFNDQELLSRKLIFCEFFTAFSILKSGGDFTCKLFSIFTSFMSDLIYLATCLFERVYIVKPISCRVANSEQFLVCKGFKGISNSLLTQLREIVYKEEMPNTFLKSNNSIINIKSQIDAVNEKTSKTQINYLSKIIEASINGVKNEEKLKLEQKNIRKRVSSMLKINTNPALESTPGFLNYSPTYGQNLSLGEVKNIINYYLENTEIPDEISPIFIIKTGKKIDEEKALIRKQYIYLYDKNLNSIQQKDFEIPIDLIGKIPYDSIFCLYKNEKNIILIYEIIYIYKPDEGYLDLVNFNKFEENSELYPYM